MLEDVRAQSAEHVRAGRSVALDHGLGTRAVRDDYKSFVTEHGDPEFGVMSPDTLAWMVETSEHPDGEGEELP